MHGDAARDGRGLGDESVNERVTLIASVGEAVGGIGAGTSIASYAGLVLCASTKSLFASFGRRRPTTTARATATPPTAAIVPTKKRVGESVVKSSPINAALEPTI